MPAVFDNIIIWGAGVLLLLNSVQKESQNYCKSSQNLRKIQKIILIQLNSAHWFMLNFKSLNWILDKVDTEIFMQTLWQ